MSKEEEASVLSKNNKATEPLRLLVELGVIILGVLIALMGESWWHDRENREMEREYLEDLGVEMLITDSALAFVIDADSTHAAEVLALQNVLLSDGPPPADSAWVRGAYDVAFEEVSMETGTLHALFQTGDIRLIRSHEIRVQLSSLQARLASHAPLLRSLEELIYSQYLDAMRQVYRVEEDGTASISGLRESADYKAAIDARWLLLEARVYYHRQLLEGVRDLIATLPSGEN